MSWSFFMLMSVHVRDYCLFCWYCWNCWPSLFKHSFKKFIIMHIARIQFTLMLNNNQLIIMLFAPFKFSGSLIDKFLFTFSWNAVHVTLNNNQSIITLFAPFKFSGSLIDKYLFTFSWNAVHVTLNNNQSIITLFVHFKFSGGLTNNFLLTFQLKHGKDAFLILTTDGITFVLNDQELIDIICCCSTPKEAASFVVDQALQFGSEDNSTAVVIPLGAWGKYRTTMRAIPYSFGRNLERGRYS